VFPKFITRRKIKVNSINKWTIVKVHNFLAATILITRPGRQKTQLRHCLRALEGSG